MLRSDEPQPLPVSHAAEGLYWRIAAYRKVEVDIGWIAARSGADSREELAGWLTELRGAGLIEVWFRPGEDFVVVLAPWSAWLARVRLCDRGIRWVRASKPDRPWRRYYEPTISESRLYRRSGGSFDRIAVTVPNDGEHPDPVFRDAPKVLLGQRVTWDHRQPHNKPCVGCGDRPLSKERYCLICDRWGMDPPAKKRCGRPPKARPTADAATAETKRPRCPGRSFVDGYCMTCRRWVPAAAPKPASDGEPKSAAKPKPGAAGRMALRNR